MILVWILLVLLAVVVAVESRNFGVDFECGICGRSMYISKRKYRKWEDGDVVIYCNDCWKGGART